MGIIRRFFGIFVMLAGIIGLVLSVAGLAGTWLAKPLILTSAGQTLTTLSSTLDTSDRALVVTNDALVNTVTSIDALAVMLKSTSLTVTDTQPVIHQVNIVLDDTLPRTIDAATDSLKAAEQAAASLEGAIKGFESFRVLLSAVPLIGSTMPPLTEAYNPEKPLADSLGDLTLAIEDLPESLRTMAKDLDKSDDNLTEVKTSLDTMSVSVSGISDSLRQYQTMIGESRSSMGQLNTMIEDTRRQLPYVLDIAAIVLTFFFVWLLAAQIVIFSQGLELFNGTALRMDTQQVVIKTVEPVTTVEVPETKVE